MIEPDDSIRFCETPNIDIYQISQLVRSTKREDMVANARLHTWIHKASFFEIPALGIVSLLIASRHGDEHGVVITPRTMSVLVRAKHRGETTERTANTDRRRGV